MKKNWFIRLLALTAALLLCCFAAVAEEEFVLPPEGYVPERGISLPFTEEDTAAGLSTAYFMSSTEVFPNLPLLEISYTDIDAMNALFEQYTEEDLEDDEIFYEVLTAAFSLKHNLFDIILLETDRLNEALAAGATVESLLGWQEENGELSVLTENDGYTYMICSTAANSTYEDEALKQKVLAMAARAQELLDSAEYMPVVFGVGEVTVTPDAFPAFETVDLNGSVVTSEIFSGKDLTVINIWGTYCNPCIDEMPDLAEWSTSMPENMQLIGLVSDLSSADDAETLELAQMICEATGANVEGCKAAAEALLAGM